jgi:phosphatidylserine/phosphatidylglycerophosphate/cardiolipin synthase-like enzyme
VRGKQGTSLMHLKSYLSDSQVLRAGSPNFSAPGLKRQDNDSVVIRDARSIAQFAETFERLWARPRKSVEA